MVSYIILFYLQIIITFSKIKQLFMSEDEYQYLSRMALIIATNETEIDENEFSDIKILQENARTLSKQLSNLYRNQTEQSDFVKVFTSVQYDNSAIDICFSKFGIIQCKYRIMNQMIDENLVILESYQYTLFFENNLCEQLHNIQINKFIMQCRSIQGMLIVLINDKSEIIDSLLIEPIYNQTQHSIFKGQNIIIYETLNQLCTLFVVRWSTDQNYLQIKQLTLNGNDYMDLQLVGQVNNVQFQESNVLIIYFSYFVLYLNLLNFSITTPFILNNHDVQYFQFIPLSQSNSEIIIYLDNKIQKTFEIGNKEFRINPQFQVIEKVQFINQNIIIKFKSLLYIVNNQIIYDILEIDQSQVIFLENLPFILIFKKQALQFYKINSFPFYFKYQPSTYLSVFWCIEMIIHEKSTIYRMNKLSNNLTILLDNQPIHFDIQDYIGSQVIYHYKNNILGYPSQVTHFVDKNGVISNIQNSDLILSNIMRNTILLTIKNAEFSIQIIFHGNQTFTISDEINKIYLKHQYRFNLNESQFFISAFENSFIVQEKQTLYYYSYINTEIKVIQINFEKQINYLVQQDDQLYIYFENCMQMVIQLQTFEFQEINYSHQVNCTILSTVDGLNIKIQSSQIDILRMNTYIQSLRFNKIVRLQYFLNHQRLLIFELIQNLLYMKLYQEKNNNYYFLYKLPTYSYIIDQPLQYKTFMQMIAILAHNEQNDQYILIYDMHSKALNSMIQIIQVDEKCHMFNFLSSQAFCYIFNNELRVLYLNSVKLNFKSDLFKQNLNSNLNSYIQETDVILYFDPKYVINNNSIILNFQFINCNQRLELLTSNIQNYFIYNKTKILKFNDVFGKINSVTYYNNEDKQINLTSFTIVDQQICQLFKQKTCIIENNEIVIDSFGLKLPFQFNRIQIINGFTLYQSEFNIFVYTIEQEQVLKVYNYNLEGKLIEQGRIQTQIQQDIIVLNSLKVVGNFILFDSTNIQKTQILFLIQNNELQQFLINSLNEFKFISIHQTPNLYFITYETYCLTQRQEILTFLFLSLQFDIITQTTLELRQIINKEFINEIVRFQDSEFIQDDDNFKLELLICFTKLQCYYLQFQFDLQLNFLESKILKILRYDITLILKKIEFSSSKYIILSFYNNGNIKYIYNIDQSNKFIIDTHQQIELEDYHIEKYNDTYFSIFKCNPYCDVKLLQLHNYYVPCQQACDNSSVNVLLSNQVNQLNLTFIYNMPKEERMTPIKITSQQLIIVITGVLLLLYLCKAQKKPKKN